MPNYEQITVNGSRREVEAEPSTSLLEFLRNDLQMTGTKYGCGEAECGACTVLIDGIPTRSCITSLQEVGQGKITTIEGLEKDGKLNPVQQAFVEEGAMQCGYCIPGMIVSATGLLQKNPNPTDAQILEHMQGNVCRCGGYPKMLAAIKRAAKAMRGEK